MLKNSQDFVENPEKYYNVLETKIDDYSRKPEKVLISLGIVFCSSLSIFYSLQRKGF